MRRFRPPTILAPVDRLARAVMALPEPAVTALYEVVARTDLPLVAGAWRADAAGCLVANVLAARGVDPAHRTLDVAVLDTLPELSSRDLNRLIVAWDEAASDARAVDDAALRSLLGAALEMAATRSGVGRG